MKKILAAIGRVVKPLHKALAAFASGGIAVLLSEVVSKGGVSFAHLNLAAILGGAVVAGLGVYVAPKNQSTAPKGEAGNIDPGSAALGIIVGVLIFWLVRR